MQNFMKIAGLVLLLAACRNSGGPSPETRPWEPVQAQQEWVSLFDGSSLEGWRGYNMDTLPPGWTIRDSTLTFDTELGLEQDYAGGKDILSVVEMFENFELQLEWKLPEGGNSGTFYHVREGYDGPPVVAPEYQLIDDLNYAKIHDLTAYNTAL